jgi:phospholipid/cholesterol/gamma-HCH transport system substrate-binding protein
MRARRKMWGGFFSRRDIRSCEPARAPVYWPDATSIFKFSRMTPDRERATQLKVGLFTLCGLLLMAGMVTYFGRLGEGFKSFYEVRVEYPNASGLINGAEVLMAGARIGQVAEGPNILPGGRGVYVNLKIYEGVEIPANSTFTIGSSGLLGDRFVDITMPPEGEAAPAILPGEIAQGKRETGFAELSEEGAKLVADMREAVQSINRVVKRIDEELLSSQTVGDIGETISGLQKTSTDLSAAAGRIDGILTETSGKLDDVLDKASATVAESTKTMQAATGAAKEFERTAADFRKIAQDARKGDGLMGLLLYDRETADNIRALIANLRSRGVLFYRDRAEQER